MANFTDHRAWTDLLPHSKLLPPNVIITAEELAVYGEAQVTSDLYQLGSELRKVVYDDLANSRKYYMELVLYVHPPGAADVALYTGGASVCNGRFLTWAGAYTAGTAAQDNDDIAGVLLSHYYTATITPASSSVNFIATTLTAGDAIWLVRRGMMELPADVHPTALGVNLTVDNATATGRVSPSVALAASTAGIQENLTEPIGRCVGICREATVAAAGEFLLCEVLLPGRFSRP